MNNSSDNGFIIFNNVPKTCDEIHREAIGFASAVPNHKTSVFECQKCGKLFNSKDYSQAS